MGRLHKSVSHKNTPMTIWVIRSIVMMLVRWWHLLVAYYPCSIIWSVSVIIQFFFAIFDFCHVYTITTLYFINKKTRSKKTLDETSSKLKLQRIKLDHTVWARWLALTLVIKRRPPSPPPGWVFINKRLQRQKRWHQIEFCLDELIFKHPKVFYLQCYNINMGIISWELCLQ